MSLNLDKSTWKRVVLGDVIRHVTDRVDPETSGLTRFLAGEHIPSRDLHIRHWGEIGRDPIGPMFYKRFKPGHVLYVSRRSYLRKTAVPEFEGICGEKTFVLETLNPSVLLQEFLPFVLSAERFHTYAVSMSRGSVNPYVNWAELTQYEFDLPPLEEQKRLNKLLWTAEQEARALKSLHDAILKVRGEYLQNRMREIASTSGTVPLDRLIDAQRPITYGILMPGNGHDGGIPVVKVKDFPNGRIHEADLLLTTPELAYEYRRSTLRPGDLLISIRGTIGRMAEVPDSLNAANITQDTARLSIASEHNRQYIRLVLESDFAQSQIRKRTTGLAVKGLNIGALRKLEIPIPPHREQEERLVAGVAVVDRTVSEISTVLAASADLRRSLLVDVSEGAT